MCLCVCIQGVTGQWVRGWGMLMEHTTKFQPNKALSVYSTAGKLWETVKGENTGLCLDDCMSDACFSLPFSLLLFFFEKCFLARCCSKNTVLSSSLPLRRSINFYSLFCINFFPSLSACCKLVSIRAVWCLWASVCVSKLTHNFACACIHISKCACRVCVWGVLGACVCVCEYVCVCGLNVVPGFGTQRSRGADLPRGLNLVRRGRREVRSSDVHTDKHTHTRSTLKEGLFRVDTLLHQFIFPRSNYIDR